jgi:hypothetical protein
MKIVNQLLPVFNSIINLISTAIGVFVVGSLISGEKVDENVRPAIWFIIVIATLFLINNYLLRRKLSHHNLKYAEGFRELNIGFARLHELHNIDLKSGEKEHNRNKVYNGLRELATSLSMLFSKVKGSDCPVCIKILMQDQEVETICRDTRSESTRTKNQDTRSHTVQSNTDFENILISMGDPDKRYFLGNNLPGDPTYKNSSIDSRSNFYPEKAANRLEKFYKYLNRRTNWPLPYRSTLVVPIFPLIRETDENNTQPIGFLCVDSRIRRTFNHRVDLDIMKGVADGLYYYLKDFKPLLLNDPVE